jgi:hypothetical protein
MKPQDLCNWRIRFLRGCEPRFFERARQTLLRSGCARVTDYRSTQSHPELGSIVPGVFTPVLAKHTKSFNLVDTLSVGVYRIQRNFEPLQRQVETSVEVLY